jgi:hypothetical protein
VIQPLHPWMPEITPTETPDELLDISSPEIYAPPVHLPKQERN